MCATEKELQGREIAKYKRNMAEDQQKDVSEHIKKVSERKKKNSILMPDLYI
jgi:hypothetical protein